MGRELVSGLRAPTSDLARNLVQARAAEPFDPSLFFPIPFYKIFVVRCAQRDGCWTNIFARPRLDPIHPFEETRRRPPRIRLEEQRAGNVTRGGSLPRREFSGLEQHRRTRLDEIDARRTLSESRSFFLPRLAHRVVDAFGGYGEDPVRVPRGHAVRAEDQRFETGRPSRDDRLRDPAEAEGDGQLAAHGVVNGGREHRGREILHPRRRPEARRVLGDRGTAAVPRADDDAPTRVRSCLPREARGGKGARPGEIARPPEAV